MCAAERLSTGALAIPFVGREDELDAARRHLSPDGEAGGRALVVHGDSGTGKTFFVREVMRRALATTPEALSLYIDVANDDYQSSRTIGSLLKISLVAGPTTGGSMISVPEEVSLLRYRRQSKRRGVGRGLLRAVAGAFGGAGGAAVTAALDEGAAATASQLEDELTGYLSWVAKRQPVFVTIDNVQFLNLDVRLTIESILQRVGKNVVTAGINRSAAESSQEAAEANERAARANERTARINAEAAARKAASDERIVRMQLEAARLAAKGQRKRGSRRGGCRERTSRASTRRTDGRARTSSTPWRLLRKHVSVYQFARS